MGNIFHDYSCVEKEPIKIKSSLEPRSIVLYLLPLPFYSFSSPLFAIVYSTLITCGWFAPLLNPLQPLQDRVCHYGGVGGEVVDLSSGGQVGEDKSWEGGQSAQVRFQDRDTSWSMTAGNMSEHKKEDF